MKRIFTFAAAALAAALMISCGQQGVKVSVENASDLDRNAETVELDFGEIIASNPEITADNVVVTDASGAQIPSQVYTEDYGMVKLIFQATVPAHQTAEYSVKAGEREAYDTLVFSRYVPERLDDYAYENNRIAGRVYGPALKFPRTLGPDIWTKSVETLVVDKRFALNDYHHDHGDGMDCYKVDATLGGGALAPYIDGKIVLGDNYETYDRICNGPIRTKVLFTYKPFDAEGHQITSQKLPVALGAVLRNVLERTDGDHYIAFTEKASDSADPDADGNISVGLVVDAAEENVEADTVDGHAVLKYSVMPGKRADVWIGSGWSKGGIESPEAWAGIVKDFAYAQANPLKVTVE